MAEQPEPRHVRDRVRHHRPDGIGGGPVQRAHPPHGLGRVGEPPLRTAQDERGAERLRQVEKVAGPRAGLRPHRLRIDGADDGQAVLLLGVANRVAAGEQRPGIADGAFRPGKDTPHDLHGQVFRERRHGEGQQRQAPHREDVVERVRRRDRAEVVGVVDDRREEVDGEDQRPLGVEPVDGGVVGRVEADQQILGRGGHESAEQFLEPRGRKLRGAAAGGRQISQLHRGDAHGETVDDRTARPRPGRKTAAATVTGRRRLGRGTWCTSRLRPPGLDSSPDHAVPGPPGPFSGDVMRHPPSPREKRRTGSPRRPRHDAPRADRPRTRTHDGCRRALHRRRRRKPQRP